MLRVASSMNQLNFRQLMNVYQESNQKNGAVNYPRLSAPEQAIRAEDEMYRYLRDCVFATKMGFCGIWELDGLYVSALRIEQYRDAWLLTALETLPEVRNKGYGTLLVRGVLSYLEEMGTATVFSHIAKGNGASIAVHKACGFDQVLDYAVFMDGSVTQAYSTFRHVFNK